MDSKPDWPRWRAAMDDVVVEVTAPGTCPCAWPRVRHVLSFHFRPYGSSPVLCQETELLHRKLLDDTAVYEHLASVGGPGQHAGRLRCRTCGSEVHTGWEEYSISFQCVVARWETVAAAAVGAPVTRPVPLYGGLAGHCRDFTPFEADWVQTRDVDVVRDWLLERA